MREVYRNNRSIFPDQGAILYVLKKCEEREVLESEMLRLGRKIRVYIDSMGE